MSDFFWASGHLGWGIFAVAVFTGLWVLLADVCWRLKNTRITRFGTALAVGWTIGVVLILLGFQIAHP